jgi:hypothetical protein
MSFLDKLKSLFAGTRQDDGSSALPEIPCEEVLSFVHDFLDGELPGGRRIR